MTDKSLKLTALRPEYLPGLAYFWKLAQCDALIFTDHFQYVKRSPITVSPPLSGFGSSLRIPVRHTEKPLAIKDKKIDTRQPWQGKHFKSLYHQFHLTPFGYYYLPRFEEIYMKNSENLSDFLIELLESIIRFLHLPLKTARASQLGHAADNTQTLIDWRHSMNYSYYLTSKEALEKGWIDRKALEKADIKTAVFEPLPDYHILQSYNGFSAVGFLMQYGPEAGYILKQYLPV